MKNPSRPVLLRSIPILPLSQSPNSSDLPTHEPRPNSQPNRSRYYSYAGRFKFHIAAVIALITLIITIISLLPSFRGAEYAKDALKLARWTARKDYTESCHEVSDSKRPSGFLDLYKSSLMPVLKYLNRSSIGCPHALEDGLAPPPALSKCGLFYSDPSSDWSALWIVGVLGRKFCRVEDFLLTRASLGG